MPRKGRLTAKKCHLTLLNLLKKLKKDDLKEMLFHLSDSSIDHICETLYNIAYSELSMPLTKKRHLRKILSEHQCAYKKITNKSRPVAERRKLLLNQSGGSLGCIFSAAVPILVDLIRSAVQKKNCA